MAKLSAHGRTELLRLIQQDTTNLDDDLGRYSVRRYRAYMSDGKVLAKSQIKNLSDPNPKWGDGHWSMVGTYDINRLDGIKEKRIAAGWRVTKQI